MVVSGGVRWCAALGVLGLTVGAWAQPAGVRGSTQLAPKVHDYYAECRNPDTELCTVQSPDSSLYMYTVLTPDIPFDDLGAHWVVDLRKFPAAKGAIKVLRVATSTGEVHAIRLKLVYGATLAQNSAGAKVLTVPPEAKPATTSTAPAAAPSQPSTSITAKPPSSSLAVSVAKPAPAAPPQPPSHSTETQQSGRAEQPVSSAKKSTSSPIQEKVATGSKQQIALKPICLDGICVGTPVQKLSAPLEPTLSLKEHLRSGLRADPHRFPDLEDRANRLETLYKKGDMDGFAEEAMDWIKSSNKASQLEVNLFHLRQAYLLAYQALGNKHSIDTVSLALYLTPQVPRDRHNQGASLTRLFNSTANPLIFIETNALRFDAELGKLLAKTKPKFCDVYRMVGHYTSKSGYPTLVGVQSDIDGELKVSDITRVFSSSSKDSLQLFARDLNATYEPYKGSDLISIDVKYPSITLVLRHPMLVHDFNATSLNAKRTAVWQQGWMDFKEKGGDMTKIMQAIRERNQATLPGCKPKVLPLN